MMLAERHGSPNSHQMEAHSELHHHASAATVGNNTDDNLHTFREALAISSEFFFFFGSVQKANSVTSCGKVRFGKLRVSHLSRNFPPFM
jgi:hypothetical protein